MKLLKGNKLFVDIIMDYDNAVSGLLVSSCLNLRPAGSWIHSATWNDQLGFGEKWEREITPTASESRYEILTEVESG